MQKPIQIQTQNLKVYNIKSIKSTTQFFKFWVYFRFFWYKRDKFIDSVSKSSSNSTFQNTWVPIKFESLFQILTFIFSPTIMRFDQKSNLSRYRLTIRSAVLKMCYKYYTDRSTDRQRKTDIILKMV